MSRPADPKPKARTKRERTRAALVAAALEVIAEKGFAAASLDEIAARAGMTKGAIYSNFSGKAELLLSAMGARGLTLSSSRPPAATLEEELQIMARDLTAMIRRARTEERFLAEFQVYALADPEVRMGMAAAYSEGFGGTAEYLSRLNPRMEPRVLAVALQALSLGLLIQSFITPDEVTPEVIAATIDAFAQGLSREEPITSPAGVPRR
jgi:AcrR family transcriptional regulator